MRSENVTYTTVGDIARRHGVRPSQVTQLFTERRIPEDLCPVISGRRLIPIQIIPAIVAELRRKGIAVQPSEEGEND